MHALTPRCHSQNLLQTTWRSIAMVSARQGNNTEYLCRKRKSSQYFQRPSSQSCSLQISRCHLQSCTFPYSQQCLKNRPEDLAPNKLHIAVFEGGLKFFEAVWPQLYSHPLPLLCVWRHNLWVLPVTHFEDGGCCHPLCKGFFIYIFFFPGYSFSRFLSAILAPMAPQDEKPLPTWCKTSQSCASSFVHDLFLLESPI